MAMLHDFVNLKVSSKFETSRSFEVVFQCPPYPLSSSTILPPFDQLPTHCSLFMHAIKLLLRKQNKKNDENSLCKKGDNNNNKSLAAVAAIVTEP